MWLEPAPHSTSQARIRRAVNSPSMRGARNALSRIAVEGAGAVHLDRARRRPERRHDAGQHAVALLPVHAGHVERNDRALAEGGAALELHEGRRRRDAARRQVDPLRPVLVVDRAADRDVAQRRETGRRRRARTTARAAPPAARAPAAPRPRAARRSRRRSRCARRSGRAATRAGCGPSRGRRAAAPRTPCCPRTRRGRRRCRSRRTAPWPASACPSGNIRYVKSAVPP